MEWIATFVGGNIKSILRVTHRNKKGCVLGFFVVELIQVKFKHKLLLIKKKKKQMGGFLNHYYFAYAGRDTINQARKVAPGVIKNASN